MNKFFFYNFRFIIDIVSISDFGRRRIDLQRPRSICLIENLQYHECITFFTTLIQSRLRRDTLEIAAYLKNASTFLFSADDFEKGVFLQKSYEDSLIRNDFSQSYKLTQDCERSVRETREISPRRSRAGAKRIFEEFKNHIRRSIRDLERIQIYVDSKL